MDWAYYTGCRSRRPVSGRRASFAPVEDLAKFKASSTYALLSGLARLPLPALHALSWLAYGLVYRVFRYRRAIVRRNLAGAWPRRPERSRRRLERRFYRFLCDHFFENLYSARIGADELKRRVALEMPEPVDGRGALLLFCHQGNLTWALQRVAIGIPMRIHCVHKPLHNAGAERFQRRARQRFGCRMVADREIGADVLRHRRAGARAVSLALDHCPDAAASRCWCRFMNRDTAFSDAARKAIRAMRMPVFYVHARRLRRGYYALRLERLAETPGPRERFGTLLRYIERAEQDIRAQPETWLWSMRRWKLSRRADEPLSGPGAPAAGA